MNEEIHHNTNFQANDRLRDLRDNDRLLQANGLKIDCLFGPKIIKSIPADIKSKHKTRQFELFLKAHLLNADNIQTSHGVISVMQSNC